jgi:hypothetical protein
MIDCDAIKSGWVSVWPGMLLGGKKSIMNFMVMIFGVGVG